MDFKGVTVEDLDYVAPQDICHDYSLLLLNPFTSWDITELVTFEPEKSS